MPDSEHRLRTRDDFQRFCAELRRGAHELDDLVEGLRDLASSELRAIDKGRFAQSIARSLVESFHPAEVQAVALTPWPPEIAMALRSHAPPPDAGAAGVGAEAREDPELLELSVEPESLPTVVLLGDEDEHRHSIERLRAAGFHCLRQGSTDELHDVFGREEVVGLVVGSSFWARQDPEPRAQRAALLRILECSNLGWIKLVRSAAWAAVQDEVEKLCEQAFFSVPPFTRLVIEEQITLSRADLRRLVDTARTILYAERAFHYDFQPSIVQDRMLRAAIARHLRDQYRTLHAQEPSFCVRRLADRGEQGLVALVSVQGTDVAFVVKISPYRDAWDEARRFRKFAHGGGFNMEFFCHATLGALVVAPIGTSLGQARSLEDVLSSRRALDDGTAETGRSEAFEASTVLIESAIAALERFSRQARAPGDEIYCRLERDETERALRGLGRIVVAGEDVDLRELYRRGMQTLDRCSRGAIVHGDAHPGNILFTVTHSAMLIDYECAGLGPPCTDLCTLWIMAFATCLVAVEDERSTTALVADLLTGVPFEELQARWPRLLGHAANREIAYLSHRALAASGRVMAEHGASIDDVYGVIAVILCRELWNPRLQQFAVRCALAATWSVLGRAPS